MARLRAARNESSAEGGTALVAHLSVEAAAARRVFYLSLGELQRRNLGDDAPVGGPLAGHELKVFSQNGEDGVIAEVLRRAGTGDGYFAEIGAGSGSEGNCVALADIREWAGVFIEGGDEPYRRLAAKYEQSPRVQTVQAMVSPDTIDALLQREAVPPDFDVLSIDIDSTDYWIWRALDRYRPRLVVIEYNAALGTTEALTLPRDYAGAWDGTQYFGASIRALCDLATAKDYCLVHTDLSGSNAFFVRRDLAGDFPPEERVVIRPANYLLTGLGHAAANRQFVAPTE